MNLLRPALPLSSRSLHATLCLALLLVLAACGGGGGDTTGSPPGGNSGDTPPADPNVAALASALTTGNASAVSLPYVLAATQAQLSTQATAYAATRQALFGLNADGSTDTGTVGPLDWDPSHDSAYFTVLDQGRNQVMLTGNWRYSDGTAGSNTTLAVAGTAPTSQARYAAFGGNPLAVAGNAAMDAYLKNTVAWLTQRSNFTGLKVVTAHLPGKATYWFPHEAKVRTWLATQFPGVTLNGLPADQVTTDDSCDGDKLDTCLQGADLLVIGRQQGPNVGNSSTPDTYPAGTNSDTVMQAVSAAQARHIPVLYLHHDGDTNDLAGRLLGYFGLAANENYWAQEGLKAFAPANLPATPAFVADTQALLQRLDSGSFSTTWSGCVDNLGRVSCDGDASFVGEFLTPAQALRTRLRALDAKGTALFSQAGYEQEKLLVLLGDKYREAVSYPMAKETAGKDFFKAYFSDMTAYINRPAAAVAKNLGNFSGLFPTSTTTLARTITTAAPEVGKLELMTGLYVMPGRTVTLTRTDSSPATVTMGLNMLRDTTHLYNTLDRPTLLASPRVPLVAGKPLTLTSPYGGPLYLFVGAVSGAPTVSVQVDGVITHPVLRDVKDAAQVAAFRAELASTPTNWVGVTTDFLTVHSNLTNFRKTLADNGDDLDKVLSQVWTYMVKDTYELAGFNSATAGTFTLPTSVSAFCNTAGWDCTGLQHRRDTMQHVISDNYANCGAGCSGNPYDQDWALAPLGWGETHEIGHNLQTARLKIYAGQSGEVSNNIFPNHKQMAFNRATLPASPMSRSGTGAKAAFTLIQASLATADPTAHVKANMWSDTTYAANNGLRLSFYRQLVEYARTYNTSFSDGWELYTLMYLLDRNLTAASGTWAASASGLGFGTYASYPSGMDGNDFMLIASSRIIGRDMRPVFAMWGITTSTAAGAQVAAYALPVAEKLLFPMNNVNQYGAGVGSPIAMSANATYPAGY